METNKKLQNLIGAILNKDYFKLEFGCKIIYQNKDYVYLCPTIQEWFKSFELYSNKTINIAYSEDFEILGQEPTLNDVLLAIKVKYGPTIGIFINQYGLIYKMVEEIKSPESMDPVLVKFQSLSINLEKSIFNQEEEVKVALIGLLEDK